MNKSKASQLVEEWRKGIGSQLSRAFEARAEEVLTGTFATGAKLEPTDKPFDIEALYEAVNKMNAIVEEPWRKLFAANGADFDKHLLVLPESCRCEVDVPSHILRKQVAFGPVDAPTFFNRSGLGLNVNHPLPIFKSNVV
jgi:hypothetical protein